MAGDCLFCEPYYRIFYENILLWQRERFDSGWKRRMETLESVHYPTLPYDGSDTAIVDFDGDGALDCPTVKGNQPGLSLQKRLSQ
jgi:hypothetical protein